MRPYSANRSRLDFEVGARGWCYLLEGERVVDKGEFDACARRDRRCCVYENTPGSGFHLLVVDDDGGLILVEKVIDFETAEWLTRLVNNELAKQGALL